MADVSRWSRAGAEMSARLRGWPRLVLAAVCAALAALSAVNARTVPDPTARRAVVVAARPIAAGTTLRSGDVMLARWLVDDAPPAALGEVRLAVGAVLAAAMTAGEPVTPARLRGVGLTVGLPPGMLAVAVVLDNPRNAEIVQAGDLVDLLLVPEVDPGAASVPAAQVLARAVRVLATLAPAERLESTGATLVVAADHTTAVRVAAASGRAVVATLRAPP